MTVRDDLQEVAMASPPPRWVDNEFHFEVLSVAEADEDAYRLAVDSERLHYVATYTKQPFAFARLEDRSRGSFMIPRLPGEAVAPCVAGVVATALRRLCGKDFVDALHVAHDRYGAALGITKPDATVRASVLEPHRALTAALEQYVRVVLGTVLDDDDDSVDLARRRLRPIEATMERARSAPRGSAANGPIEPATPHPPEE